MADALGGRFRQRQLALVIHEPGWLTHKRPRRTNFYDAPPKLKGSIFKFPKRFRLVQELLILGMRLAHDELPERQRTVAKHDLPVLRLRKTILMIQGEFFGPHFLLRHIGHPRSAGGLNAMKSRIHVHTREQKYTSRQCWAATNSRPAMDGHVLAGFQASF